MPKRSPHGLDAAVIYQVFTRNYSRNGTFAEVARDLARIKDLGTDILYLTPIHPIGKIGRKGSVGSPYAIADYRAVDRASGGLEGFRRLIDAARPLGLIVMIDVVFNHTSLDSRLLKENPEWFFRDPQGSPGRKCADWSDGFDLDYGHPELREYLIETLDYWAEIGVGGFRCDVASLVPVDFWIEARKRLNTKHSLVWLAESVHPSFVSFLRDAGYGCACDAELYGAFDLTYDYDAFALLQEYMAGRLPLTTYLGYLEFQRSLLPGSAAKIRFLENHDQERAARSFGDGSRLRNWTAFTYLLPGTNFIYMGQEFAISKKPSLFEKDPVKWKSGDGLFREFFGKVLAVSRRVKERNHTWRLWSPAEGLAFMLWQGGEDYLAILNLENRYGEFAPGMRFAGTNILDGVRVESGDRMPIPTKPQIIRLKN